MTIYKVVTALQWREAENAGVFSGSPVDLADGYIHFSTARQLRETVRRHFAGRRDLLLVCVNAEEAGPALKWEVSRGGERFPHLYGELRLDLVGDVRALPLEGGEHRYPPDIPQ